MLVNDAALKTILPLRGSSRQISPFHIFAWASFSVWNVFPASLGPSYSPISQGQSLAPLLRKPSRRTPGPGIPRKRLPEREAVLPRITSCKRSQPGGRTQIQSSLRPLSSLLHGRHPSYPVPHGQLCPAFCRLWFPPSPSPCCSDFLLGRKKVFFSHRDDSLLVAIDYS